MKSTIRITKPEFEALKPALLLDLKNWWDDETQSLDEAVRHKKTSDEDVWRLLPAIDSKCVMKASVIFEDHLGVDLDPSMVRPGGYPSFEAMLDHLLPQIAAACSVPTAVVSASVH